MTVFLALWLQNVLHATTACHSSRMQLQKVLREWQFFTVLASKCSSRHNGVEFSFLLWTDNIPPAALVTWAYFGLLVSVYPTEGPLVLTVSTLLYGPYPPCTCGACWNVETIFVAAQGRSNIFVHESVWMMSSRTLKWIFVLGLMHGFISFYPWFFQHVTVLFYRQIPCLVDIFFAPGNFHPKLAWETCFETSTPSLPGNMLWNFHPQLAREHALKLPPPACLGCNSLQFWTKCGFWIVSG